MQYLTKNSDLEGEFIQDYFQRVDAVLDIAWDLSSRDNMGCPTLWSAPGKNSPDVSIVAYFGSQEAIERTTILQPPNFYSPQLSYIHMIFDAALKRKRKG